MYVSTLFLFAPASIPPPPILFLVFFLHPDSPFVVVWEKISPEGSGIIGKCGFLGMNIAL